MFAPVDVVAKEEIVLVGRRAEDPKQAEQVLKLSVNIATDLYRGFQFYEHRLFLEHTSGERANSLNLMLLDCAKLILSVGGFGELNDDIVDI